MKILFVNFSDCEGGASRAAYRLFKSLIENKIDCKMLVQSKKSDDIKVIGPTTISENIINKLRPKLADLPLNFYKKRKNIFFSSSGLTSNTVIRKIKSFNPDIVHLHWINKGMLSLRDLERINIPIVWSLHDSNTFTGGCHITLDCNRYKNSCGLCPVLRSEKENDLSFKIWRRKNKIYSKVENITIVGLSNWINKCSMESSLLKNKEHYPLPNLINTEKFKPLDKFKSRDLLNLPKEKKIILFGAINGIADFNKGFVNLTKALPKLNNINFELVVFGCSAPTNYNELGFKTHFLGKLDNDISLATLYNAADVVIVPSFQENLSNVIMESLACSTPVVAFDIGGNRDLIDHKINGYLARAFDSSDLALGIDWILNSINYNILCQNARSKILSEFDSKIVSKKYIKLYKNILRDFHKKINKNDDEKVQ
jgi:glycosyltransferase involved in cell wall biosynthesis